MTRTRPALTRLAAVVAVPLLVAGLAGCSGSVSVGSKSVKAADVESKIETFLTDQGGTDITVDCPEDLDGKKGATAECDASDSTGDLRATVTVTSVQGTDVEFDIAVVRRLTAEDAASQAAEQLAAQNGGGTPPDVTCPDELVAEVGNTLVCTLTTEDGTAYDTTLTVTDDGDGNVGFDIQVADTPSS